jgi:hypothetical protein
VLPSTAGAGDGEADEEGEEGDVLFFEQLTAATATKRSDPTLDQ